MWCVGRPEEVEGQPGDSSAFVAGEVWDEADAHLIANAPTWLAQLLAALEAERAENERLRTQEDRSLSDAERHIVAAEAALEAKDGEVARLRVAWQRSFAMLRATYPHPDHVPLVVERVIDMMAAALAPSTPKGAP